MFNAVVKDFKSQMDLYIGCILNLRNSLKESQISLTVITNNKALLESITDVSDLNILEINFSLNVPTGINFYADHFKADVYKYFSTLDESYVGLIDNDVVAINKMPQVFKEIIDKKIPLYYDITAEIHPAYGAERVSADKRKVADSNKLGLWAGGEFIAGSPAFFKILYEEITSIVKPYFEVSSTLHHQSVEYLKSVAIENFILSNKCTVVDAGRLKIISRYWNANTLHVQNKLEAYLDSFLLHLPADKTLLANAGRAGMSSQQLVRNYSDILRKKNNMYSRLKRQLKKYIKSI